jgi:hypothetical protein
MIEKSITWIIILTGIVALGIGALGLYMYMDEILRSYFFA